MQDTYRNDNIREESTDDDHGDESVHNDDVGSCYKAMYYYEIFYVQSTPLVPPKLNYMELQLASEGTKHMKAEHQVAYAETKSA